jgi:hypothetical protein
MNRFIALTAFIARQPCDGTLGQSATTSAFNRFIEAKPHTPVYTMHKVRKSRYSCSGSSLNPRLIATGVLCGKIDCPKFVEVSEAFT